MKLLRFRTAGDAAARTGIFHESRVIETDGERALQVLQPQNVDLLPPITHAPTIRRFDSFEDAEMRFQFGNSTALIGPDAEVTFPHDSATWDFEMHLCAVIGASEADLTLAEADRYILGFTLATWFQARDAGRQGTAKQNDFAIALGPFVVTPDELEDKVVDRTQGNLYSLNLKAMVNEEVVASANASQMKSTFAELIREASRGTRLREGDVVAAGNFPGAGFAQGLKAGDTVAFVVERLGALSNRVA